MSALPLIAAAKADMYPANGHVYFPPKRTFAVHWGHVGYYGPKADICDLIRLLRQR
jgi:hypothetical protein